VEETGARYNGIPDASWIEHLDRLQQRGDWAMAAAGIYRVQFACGGQQFGKGVYSDGRRVGGKLHDGRRIDTRNLPIQWHEL
jgi:hypothetical protein